MNIKSLERIQVGIIVFPDQHMQQIDCKSVIDKPFDLFVKFKHLFTGT